MRPLGVPFIVGVLLGIASLSAAQLAGTFTNWLNHPAIRYRVTPTSDAVALLNARIRKGEVALPSAPVDARLRSVLDALQIPVESQILVFAKDSVQKERINENNPRALFFNDSVAIGWVRGGFIEAASQDPRQGVVFYTLDDTRLGTTTEFTRREDCLTCHHSYSTLGVPGMLVRSVGQFTVDHRLPFSQRWGGWYVTGHDTGTTHLGNVAVDRLFDTPRPPTPSNVESIRGRFDITGYVSTESDVGSLMVFDHQMHMMNLFSRLGWEVRVAETDGASPDNLQDAVKEVVDYMVFVDEAPLEAPVRGSQTFEQAFVRQGPRDRQGRSLRELDLHDHLLRYRCSYMIYAPLFEALPMAAKNAVYRRLWQVLSLEDADPKYAHRPQSERQAIVNILRDTKPDLPAYYVSLSR